jgi:hypothetical protein
MTTLRSLLTGFRISADDVTAFRAVRHHLPALTALRTARVLDGRKEPHVLTGQERGVYQRWALADRVQHALTLTEDIDGLATARLDAAAEVSVRLLATAVAQARTVASGHPLLGEKWTPLLLDRAQALLPETDWNARRRDPDRLPRWFLDARRTLTEALQVCWPTSSAALTDPPVPGHWLIFGWLPQRYSDGWRLKFADATIRLTEPQFLAWARAIRT